MNKFCWKHDYRRTLKLWHHGTCTSLDLCMFQSFSEPGPLRLCLHWHKGVFLQPASKPAVGILQWDNKVETRCFGVYSEEVRSSPLATAADLTDSPRAKAALSPLGFRSSAAPAARSPPWKRKCCQGRHSTRAAGVRGGELTPSQRFPKGWIPSANRLTSNQPGIWQSWKRPGCCRRGAQRSCCSPSHAHRGRDLRRPSRSCCMKTSSSS